MGGASHGLRDRCRALSTKSQLLVIVIISAAVGLVMYFGVQARKVSEPAPPGALVACEDAQRAMRLASDRTVPAVAQAGSSLFNASMRLDHAVADLARYDTLRQAMRHARNEVEAGQPHGYWGNVLVKECQRLS